MKSMHKIISFDFDGTLTRPDVQQYCQELQHRGIEIHIVTSRFDDLHSHVWLTHPNNEDLWRVVKGLGIAKENVHFMNFQGTKSAYLTNTKVLWHLDDDWVEINQFSEQRPTFGIDVSHSDWRERCENILNS